MSISNDDAAEIVRRIQDRMKYQDPTGRKLAIQAVWEQTEGQQEPQPVVVSLPEQIELSPRVAQALKAQQEQWRK